jgi:hypothetical protein
MSTSLRKLTNILKRVGQPAKVAAYSDGTRLLVLPYGGRVLGLYTAKSELNFYWSSLALATAEGARKFFAADEWPNSGGDRTWIGPEVDFFLPDFPKTDCYCQQRALDPGHYQVVETGGGLQLVNRFTVHASRFKADLNLRITKSFAPAPNPLRHERGPDLHGVAYAGYTQFTSLELLGRSRATPARAGLWNLVQMPHGGEMVIPTYSRAEPFRVFGTIPAADLLVQERAVRYRMRQVGAQKISLRAVAMCGRVGYTYRMDDQWSLIVRNFQVNPSGEYVDVPWTDPDRLGFAVQACNVNNELGAFSELEYHIPAIGHGTSGARCDDAAQVWAFRGTEPQMATARKILLGV